MNSKERINILEEINKIEEEEKKYSLPVHVIFFNEDPDEPGTYWMGFEKKKKVTQEEKANINSIYSCIFFRGVFIK